MSGSLLYIQEGEEGSNETYYAIGVHTGGCDDVKVYDK